MSRAPFIDLTSRPLRTRPLTLDERVWFALRRLGRHLYLRARLAESGVRIRWRIRACHLAANCAEWRFVSPAAYRRMADLSNQRCTWYDELVGRKGFNGN